jgi:hypothetical protein
MHNFDALTRALEPSIPEPFRGLSSDLQERIRRDFAERRDWENDPANEVVQEKLWNLQDAIKREIALTEDDAIPQLLATSPSKARDSELRRLRRYLAALTASKAELLAARNDDLHLVVDRLMKSYWHLVPPGSPSVSPDDADAPPTDYPAISPGRRPPKRGVGRPSSYNWVPAITALGIKILAEGIPTKGDGKQAKLQELVKDQFPLDNCPSDSRIKEVVVRAIRSHREAAATQGR